MRIFLTGIAGFIGFHVANSLQNVKDIEVVGIDNLNDYYDPQLKIGRLTQLGFEERDCTNWKSPISVKNLTFIRADLTDKDYLDEIFSHKSFDVVCNLAAQAGVRYSLENPSSYINSNINGFFNVLELCRHHKIKHLVYASSSSVYGKNEKIPFSETDNTDRPISLYAATKKSNEILAYSYSDLYGFPTTGLRFFTVYGPWGRPDMAYWLFTESIYDNSPITVYNNGQLERDFTYIDDITSAIVELILNPYQEESFSSVYNIGNNRPESLEYFITTLEKKIGKTAKKNYVEMQPGDMTITYANIDKLKSKINYSPTTDLSTGLGIFVDWYKNYFHIS